MQYIYHLQCNCCFVAFLSRSRVRWSLLIRQKATSAQVAFRMWGLCLHEDCLARAFRRWELFFQTIIVTVAWILQTQILHNAKICESCFLPWFLACYVIPSLMINWIGEYKDSINTTFGSPYHEIVVIIDRNWSKMRTSHWLALEKWVHKVYDDIFFSELEEKWREMKIRGILPFLERKYHRKAATLEETRRKTRRNPGRPD